MLFFQLLKSNRNWSLYTVLKTNCLTSNPQIKFLKISIEFTLTILFLKLASMGFKGYVRKLYFCTKTYKYDNKGVLIADISLLVQFLFLDCNMILKKNLQRHKRTPFSNKYINYQILSFTNV